MVNIYRKDTVYPICLALQRVDSHTGIRSEDSLDSPWALFGYHFKLNSWFLHNNYMYIVR